MSAFCLIVSDDLAHGALLSSVIARDFSQTWISTHPSQAAEMFRLYQPALLLVSYDKVCESEELYDFLMRDAAAVAAPFAHHAVLLCRVEESASAFALCESGIFHGYLAARPLQEPFQLRATAQRVLADISYRREPGLRDRHVWDESLPGQLMPQTSLQSSIQMMSPRLPEPKCGARLDHARHAATGDRPGPLNEQAPSADMLTAPIVLVIEDNPLYRELLLNLLSTKAFHVISAADGATGLLLANRWRPQLILLDIVMPNLNGLGVLKEIRSDPELADTPVIMLTGYSERDVVLQAAETGIDGFIVKPGKPAEIAAMVMDVFRGRAGIGTP